MNSKGRGGSNHFSSLDFTRSGTFLQIMLNSFLAY